MGEHEAAEPLDEFDESLDAEAPVSEPRSSAGLRAELSELTHKVRATLRPLEPPPDFVSDLRRYLAENRQRARQVAERERAQDERRLWWAAGVGGALYLAGLAGIGVRALLSVAVALAVLLHLRQPRQPGNRATT